MDVVRATIVQISDLHFGGAIDRGLLPQLLSVVQGTHPDFLVVSGDLVENPFPWSFKEASRHINDIASACNIPPERILVIPGNHDYKIKGNFGLGRLSRIPFEVYFRRDGLDKSFFKRALDYFYLTVNAFWPWGNEMRERIEKCDAPGYGISLFGFNSTPLFEMLATGKVSGDQISAISKELANEASMDDYLKIAVVHHHPAPIPYVSTKLAARVQESFMVFYNAGTFLRELGRCGVNLVLHGHKHFAGFTRVSYDDRDGERRQINILAAGSATHRQPDDPLGNELNLIRVYEDDSITLDQWYYSREVRHKDESKRYVVADLDDVRRQRVKRIRRRTGMTVAEENRTVTLTPHGYSEINVELKFCQPCKSEGVSSYEMDLVTPRPAYIRNFRLTPQDTLRFLSFQRDEKLSGLRRVKGLVTFGETRQVNDGFYELGYSYRLMNGHAINAEEFRRKYMGAGLEAEYASVQCEEGSDVIRLKIQFPFEPENVTYGSEVVYKPFAAQMKDPERIDWHDEMRHGKETARIKTGLTKSGSALELEVHQPIPGFTYRIRWSYEQASSAGSRLERKARELEFTRAKLIEAGKLAAEGQSNSLHQIVIECLGALLVDVEERNPRGDPEEKLTITLAVFDDKDAVLRIVAANSCSTGTLFNETFGPGEGCSGFSFEKGRVLFYDRERSEIQYYISPDEEAKARGAKTALIHSEVLMTIPWIDHSGISMGVISVGSSFRFSRLMRVFDLDAAGQEAEVLLLSTLTSALGDTIISKLNE